MGSYSMLERGQRRQLAALALLALTVALLVLAMQQPLAAALLALALFLVGGAAVATRPARPRRARPAIAEGVGAPTLRLELASGEVISARPVALPGAEEQEFGGRAFRRGLARQSATGTSPISLHGWIHGVSREPPAERVAVAGTAPTGPRGRSA